MNNGRNAQQQQQQQSQSQQGAQIQAQKQTEKSGKIGSSSSNGAASMESDPLYKEMQVTTVNIVLHIYGTDMLRICVCICLCICVDERAFACIRLHVADRQN